MYNYLYGEIIEIIGNEVVIDVNGVGYELGVSNYTAAECKIGQKQKLYTYLQVKADGMSLFGFATAEEKSMFLRLISVSGVGCKVALAVLSGMDSNSLAIAIFNGDTSLLTKIKGLGKKTAERLVLELKEKVDITASDFAGSNTSINISSSKEINDAIEALVALGITKNDAIKAVQKASETAKDTNAIITLALRSMA